MISGRAADYDTKLRGPAEHDERTPRWDERTTRYAEGRNRSIEVSATTEQ